MKRVLGRFFKSLHEDRDINDASLEQASSSNCAYIAASSVLGASVSGDQLIQMLKRSSCTRASPSRNLKLSFV